MARGRRFRTNLTRARVRPGFDRDPSSHARNAVRGRGAPHRSRAGFPRRAGKQRLANSPVRQSPFRTHRPTNDPVRARSPAALDAIAFDLLDNSDFGPPPPAPRPPFARPVSPLPPRIPLPPSPLFHEPTFIAGISGYYPAPAILDGFGFDEILVLAAERVEQVCPNYTETNG